MKETANQSCYEVIYAADSAAILTKSITFFIYEPGGVIYLFISAWDIVTIEKGRVKYELG